MRHAAMVLHGVIVRCTATAIHGIIFGRVPMAIDSVFFGLTTMGIQVSQICKSAAVLSAHLMCFLSWRENWKDM
jgi:hypothetical protein